MTLVKWAPKPMNIYDDFDKMIDSIFNPVWNIPKLNKYQWAPDVDIKETDKEFIVNANIPGFTKNDIKINVGEKLLTISGDKQEEVNESENYYHFRERSTGAFHRSFKLPNTVNEDKIKATFKDGVLMIEMDKHKEILPKEKEIKIN